MSTPELQQHTSEDFGRFIRSWIQNPLAIGALAPSGRLLAKRMARGLDETARVIERGAGTGTVTQALLDAGVKPENLYLVERDQHFLGILARRFPNCPLVAADALHLAKAEGREAFVSFEPALRGRRQCPERGESAGALKDETG
jgi:phospholipid N-methyltransferase